MLSTWSAGTNPGLNQALLRMKEAAIPLTRESMAAFPSSAFKASTSILTTEPA